MSADRYTPAERLVTLGLALSESRGGLTLDEMAERLGVGRRTAERLRDALDRVAGGLEATTDAEGRKRWTLPTGKLAAFAAPRADELAALKAAAARLRRAGSGSEAGLLDSLALKLEATLPRALMRRLEPDVELLLEATGALVRPGPRETVDSAMVATLRQSILASRRVRLAYRQRGTGALSRPRLCPYGFLSGDRGYLVAFNLHPKVYEYRLYVLANIEAVELLDQDFRRDPDFDLQEFAARSFGVFWDGRAYEVEWRFRPPEADARRFRFHPAQTVTEEPDGSVLVHFTASGLTEMAWHLFRWGEAVEIVKPEALKKRYRECLDEALRNLNGPDQDDGRNPAFGLASPS